MAVELMVRLIQRGGDDKVHARQSRLLALQNLTVATHL